jgi:plasmid stabilization system protein ParE
VKVFLTKRAVGNYRSIQRFLLENWSAKVSKEFEQKVLSFFEMVERFPQIGSIETGENDIRGFLLSKHTKVFYRIKGNQIIILSFFNTRSNPNSKDLK